MPQRLKMPDTDHRRGNRLLVYDAAFVESNTYAKALCNQPGKHLKLHLAHEPQVDFTQPFVPYNAKLRVLLFQLAQVLQHGMHIAALRQIHPIIQHRFEYGRYNTRFTPQSRARTGMRQSGNGAHHTLLSFFHRLILFA